MRDATVALLDAHGEEIAVGARVRIGSGTGTVRRAEPDYGVMTIVIEERNAKKEQMVRASAVEVLPDEPVEAQAAQAPAAGGVAAAQHAAGHPGGDRIYVTTWLWLLAITILEVGAAVLRLPRVLLITTLVVMSILKAILIMATFMHLRFERLQLIYTVVVPLFLGVMLFFALVPDALNNLTRVPLQAAPGPSGAPTGPAARPAGPGVPTAPGPSRPVVGATVRVTGKDNLYDPAEIAIKAGQAYEFEFKNDGTTVHNLIISAKDAAGQDFTSDIAVNAGQDSKFTVQIDKPGTYTMQCTYHPEMTGTLTVR
jgi:cytochrome c oxidase subunit 4